MRDGASAAKLMVLRPNTEFMMTHQHTRLLHALAIGLSLGTCVAAPALAQFGAPGAGMMPGRGPSMGMPKGGEPEKPAPEPPAAVPGAKARAPAVPSAHAATDMSPNDALFDAINRGDIAGARDAVNRGADLDAVNVLGMTPMELSVDLGRNDISFLLLSMRGEDSNRGARTVAHPPAQPEVTAKADTKPSRGKTARAKPVAEPAKPVAKPAPAPKLFANDGGTPQPNAGFLGFGSRQASN
jgi:hypothetical protein